MSRTGSALALAYEVTKRIKGHEYRYRVEPARNAETGRSGTRWTYLGKVADGELIKPARAGIRRLLRNEIVAVIANLLESRDASRVTVGVISYHAGISPGTFYRHFSDRDAAFGAALAFLCDECFGALPSLDGPAGTAAEERRRLSGWFEALHRAALRGRALRWFLTAPDHDKLEAVVQRTTLRNDPRALLARYFRELDAAGLARIADPPALAHGVMTLHSSILRDMALHGDAEPDAALRWAEVFPVFERAIFG
jgi:AcrR family transcriptional regulator